MEMTNKDWCIAYATLGTYKNVAKATGYHQDTVRCFMAEIRNEKGMSRMEFRDYIDSLPKTFEAKSVIPKAKKPRLFEGKVFKHKGVKYYCIEVLDSQSIVCSPIVGGKKFTRVRKFFRLDTLTE